MKNSILFLILYLLSFTANAVPQPSHILAGIGASENQYYPKTQAIVDEAIMQVPNNGMTTAEIEIGAYWPASQFISLQGLIAKYATGILVYTIRHPAKKVTVSQYSISYSALRFLSRDLDTGFFLRCDLGAAGRGVLLRDEVQAKTSIRGEYGAYLLGGVGYSMKLSRKIRGLISLNYSIMSDFSNNGSSTLFMMNMLW